MITGDQIKAARERLGETQAVFAKRFGVYQATISKWELEGPPLEGPVAMLITGVISMLAVPGPAGPQAEPLQIKAP